MVHDCRGGVAGAAVFISMYRLMQEIDDSFTENNELKQSVNQISVFHTVNDLRKDRARMIEDYPTYKLLHLCLAYYGSSRTQLKNKVLCYPKRINAIDDADYDISHNEDDGV